MLNVVLVDPGRGGNSFKTFGISHWSSYPHHGLCSISASVKKEGFHLDLVDLRSLNNWDHFKKVIVDKKPDVVGFTMRSLDRNAIMEAVSITRSHLDAKIVLGGIHPSLYPNEFVDDEKVDYIIVGEGEISFPDLLKSIYKKKNSLEKIIYGIKPNLDELPFEDKELYDYKQFIKHPIFKGIIKPPMVSLIISRGCAFNCKFCQPAEKNLYGKKVRMRSVSSVLEELILLKGKYNINSYMFQDDHLLQNKQWVTEFIEKYPKELSGVQIVCQSRSDAIVRNESMIKELVKIGLTTIIIGFESGNQRVLDFLRKGTTVEQNIKAAEICHKYNIFIAGNFMIGIPTETKEEVLDTVKMVKKIKPEIPSVTFYTPIPGSDLYEYCKEKDLSLLKDHSDFRRDPSVPKIKGHDYAFLREAMNEIMSCQFHFKFMGRIMAFVYIYTKNHLWLRNIAMQVYSKYLKIRRALSS